MKKGKLYMAGTEKTGEYIVLASTSRGRVGIRILSGDGEDMVNIGSARIRVEPDAGKPKVVKTMAAALSGWKQPDSDQYRFSTVVDGEGVADNLRTALSAIGAGSLKTEVNDNAPSWAQSLIEGLKAA